MRKACFVLAAVLTAALLLAGCQATPEQPVVIQKDTEQMIEKARETLAPETEKLPLTERYAVKEHLKKTITELDGKLVIDVDADVGVPATDRLSIVRVVPANHSQETVYALFNALCGDTKMYKSRETEDGARFTKAEIDDILVTLNKEISDAQGSGGDENEIMSLQDEVDYYKRTYTDAPDSIEDTPSDGTLEGNDVYCGETLAGKNTRVFAVEYPGKYYDYQGKFFNLYNNSDQSEPVEYKSANGKQKTSYPLYDAHLEYFDERYYKDLEYWERSKWKRVYSSGDLTQGELDKAGLTPEQAAAAAEKLFADVQIPFSVTGLFYVDISEPCYMLDCSRQVNGTNLTTAGEGVGGDGLSPYWSYEKMNIVVSSEGIIYFRWYSPYEVKETTVESATLKPFEDIESIFYTMMKTIYAPAAKQENGTTINVSYVSLQLQRIKLKDDNSEGLLTPVWCFYGVRTVDEAIKNPGMVSDWAAMGYTPLLIVNAVDGSVIDLEKGY